MQEQKNGYVGLIFLMLSVAIIGILFVTMYLTPRETAEDHIGRTDLQKAHDTIDTAQEARDTIELQNNMLENLE